MQVTIEANIVEVIYDSFVTSGDEDYLTSRLLAQKGLERAFFWAASQTIEKYLKAFLLFNGKAITGKQSSAHSIKLLLDYASKVDKTIKNIDVAPHPDIDIDKESLSYIKIFNLYDFIDDLEIHGHADNRYNSSGVTFNTGHLFALDSLAFALRKRIGVPPIRHSLKRIDDNLMKIFNDNNPWFCKALGSHNSNIPSEKFPIKYSISVTTLDFLFKNRTESEYRLALGWLNSKMKLPKNITQELKRK